MKNLESRIQLGSHLKKDVSMKTKECVRKIVRKKEELFDHINNMIAEAERKEKETTDHVDDAINNMNEILDLLCNMKQELKHENSEKLTKYQDTLGTIAKHTNQDLTDAELFWYPEFTAGRALVEDAVGTVTEITSLTSKQKNISWALNENSMELKATKIVDEEEIKCTGENFFGVFRRIFQIFAVTSMAVKGISGQGSHSTWKTWKNESTPGKPGNIMEF